LIRFLEDIRRGGQGIGFGFRPQQRPPSLALVALAGPEDAKAVGAAVDAGADAVAVSPAATGELASGVKEVLEHAKDKPRGIALVGGTVAAPTSPSAWAEMGVDFVVLGDDQPAAVMTGEVERIARVAMDFDPVQVRALEALGMDAFLLTTTDLQPGARLSIKDLVRVRLLIGSTSKPVLVSVGDKGLLPDLEVLMQTGIEGVVLEAERLGSTSLADAVKLFREAIAKLGPRRVPKRRPGEELPIIPRAAAPAASETGEGGEEQFEPE
jgi:hypothetical protein